MKKLIALLVLLTGIVLGQVQQATLTAPPPAALNQLNLTVVGGLGQSTYYYYIATHYPIGTVISNGFIVRNAPTTLSVSNYVRLNWQPIPNATSYDIIRSITPGIFTSGGSGTCVNCLVTTGVTATTYNDTTASLTLSYTLNAPVLSSVRISLDNTTHSSPYLNIDTVAGPTATLNINMPVICVSGCSGSGSVPAGIGVPFSSNGAAFTAAANFTGIPKYNGGSVQTGALFGDIVTLWGGGACVGFLKNDGTCGTSGGGGTPGGSNNDIQVNGTGSFAGGRGTLDSSGNLIALGNVKSVTGNLYLTNSANAPFFSYANTPTPNSWSFADTTQTWFRLNTASVGGMQGLLVIPSTGSFCWPTGLADASNTPTLCFAQNATGIAELNNGNLGTFADLKVRNSYATSFIGQDTAHSGLMYLQGLTSGGIALGVNDVAGTAITYVLPSTNGTTGQYLQDSGVVTCPTFLAGGPSVCHQLLWTSNIPVGDITGLGTGVSTALAANVSGTGSICLSSGSTCASGSSLLQSVSVSITSAQFKAMSGTPVTILAAQGAGTYIKVQSAVLEYLYGGTQYTAGAYPTFKVGGNYIYGGIISGTTIDGFTSSQILDWTPTTASALALNAASSGLLNGALTLVTDGPDFATGNGTWIVVVYYTVVSGL